MATTRGRVAPLAEQVLNEAGPTMSAADAARVLGCHPETVRAMARRGDLAAMGVRVLHLGRALKIVTADLRRLVAADDDGPSAA